MELEQEILPGPAEGDSTSPDAGGQQQERDYEAEARNMGWRPKEDFPGQEGRFVDAKTFVEKGEVMLPLLKKKSEAQDRKIADLERTIKQAAKFYEGVEERSYKRALADLKSEHADAVESGDVAGADRAVDKMRALDKEVAANAPKPADAHDPAQARKELNEWIGENDWYVLDDTKRRFADLQADLMGPAIEWAGGQKAWLDELGKRVDRKFAEKKPSPVSGGGNRPAPSGGGKTYNDLPATAKAACDRFIKNGIIKDRETYVRDYDFGA